MTERREAFLPWLLWNYQRQTWRHRELVIVSGSPVPAEIATAPGVRVVTVPAGLSVPIKRNAALDAARGDIVAWFDDDDWQHPARLQRLVGVLRRGAPFAGWASAWFVDLHRHRCARYPSHDRVLFNSAGFATDVARSVRFDPKALRGSDARWMGMLQAHHPARRILAGDDSFSWLCHGSNLSNPARARHFPDDLQTLRARIGEAWGDTDIELDALRARIAAGEHRRDAGGSGNGRSKRGVRVRPTGLEAEVPPHIPVAAIVNARVADLPHLAITLPHMLRQARYEFAERIVVLNHCEEVARQCARRPVGSFSDLHKLARGLVDDGLVDRCVVVEDDAACRREVLQRHFDAESLHTAVDPWSDGTLFALEQASTNYVVQFNGPTLFHTSGPSWIVAGLEAIRGDADLWFAMTQGGPPLAPQAAGADGGGSDAGEGRWDTNLRGWRYRTASTRYFLTDRRRLRGKLAKAAAEGGHASLDECLSAAMRRHGATRARVVRAGSWDLRPSLPSAPPFTSWAEGIVECVERGVVPDLQRGREDLVLHHAFTRHAWRQVLGPISATGGQGLAGVGQAKVASK